MVKPGDLPKSSIKNSPRTSTGSSCPSSTSFDHDTSSSFSRQRSNSLNQRILSLPYETGVIKTFCRSKGHGMIVHSQGSEEIFMHVSEIMSEYVPRPGDEVRYKTIPIPPHNIKKQAVDVHFMDEDDTREKWNKPNTHRT